VALLGLGLRLWGWRGEKLADLRQALHPAEIARKPVVAHPHQPFGQHVQQEAADKFRKVQRQRLVLAVAVVAVAPAHLIVVQAQDACIADREQVAALDREPGAIVGQGPARRVQSKVL